MLYIYIYIYILYNMFTDKQIIYIYSIYIYTKYNSKFGLDSWYSWAVPGRSYHHAIGPRQEQELGAAMWGPRSIAKLVHITPLTMVYGTQITIVTGCYWGESKPTILLWVTCAIQTQSMSISTAVQCNSCRLCLRMLQTPNGYFKREH